MKFKNYLNDKINEKYIETIDTATEPYPDPTYNITPESDIVKWTNIGNADIHTPAVYNRVKNIVDLIANDIKTTEKNLKTLKNGSYDYPEGEYDYYYNIRLFEIEYLEKRLDCLAQIKEIYSKKYKDVKQDIKDIRAKYKEKSEHPFGDL